MAENHLAAPKPLEEHRRLAAFAGEWRGEEMVHPSRWTEGGPATSHVTARIPLNGFYLIYASRQMSDGQEIFSTHGVLTYARARPLSKAVLPRSPRCLPPSPRP